MRSFSFIQSGDVNASALYEIVKYFSEITLYFDVKNTFTLLITVTFFLQIYTFMLAFVLLLFIIFYKKINPNKNNYFVNFKFKQSKKIQKI